MKKTKTFANYRKQIYASINGTKGNLIKLSKSTLLSKSEKEKLDKAIEALENLRVEYHKNSHTIKQNNCFLSNKFILELGLKDAIEIEKLKSEYPDMNCDEPSLNIDLKK